MSCIVLDVELTDENVIKELGLSIVGSVQGFSFCPPKVFEPNKQTSWNTKHLYGIAWSSGKLDYDKLFVVFYDIKLMNAEVFAEGLKKCRLLTNLLGQNVETLDDYGCPKIQDLVKTDSLWICSSYFSDTKQGFTVPRGKHSCMENGDSTFVLFVRVYCICVYY